MTVAAERHYQPSGVKVIVLAFALFHAAMFLWIVPADAWKSGGDLSSYINPAVGLYRHGAFVQPDDPGTPSLYRLPLYTAVIAGGLAITGGESPRPALLANLVFLLAAGLLMWRVAATWVPRLASLLLACILFNPLAIGTAYILQPLNLNALWFALAGWLLLRSRNSPRPIDLLAVGAVAGLAALTRPGGQILIAALPFALPILARLFDPGAPLKRHVVLALAAAAIGGAITLPWMLYANASGHGLRLSSVEHNTVFLRDNNTDLEFYLRGGTLHEAKFRVIAEMDRWVSEREQDFSGLTPPERSAEVNEFLLRRFTTYPLSIFAKAWSIALTNLFVGGGATNLRTALDIDAPKAWDKITGGNYNYITAFFATLPEMSPSAILVAVASVGFVVLARLAGLIGIVVAVARRDWPPLVMALGLAVYFGFIHLFVGESIYRVPIEPYLLLLGAYGLDGLLAWRNRRAVPPQP